MGHLQIVFGSSKTDNLNIHEKLSDYITQNKTWNIQLLTQVIPIDM